MKDVKEDREKRETLISQDTSEVSDYLDLSNGCFVNSGYKVADPYRSELVFFLLIIIKDVIGDCKKKTSRS